MTKKMYWDTPYETKFSAEVTAIKNDGILSLTNQAECAQTWLLCRQLDTTTRQNSEKNNRCYFRHILPRLMNRDMSFCFF